MKLLSTALLLSGLAVASCSFSSCQDKNNTDDPTPEVGEMDLEFDHVVGSQALVLDAATYTNAAGNPFTVSLFNYYVSNIKLTKADGTEWAEPESYHLVKENEAATQKVTLKQIPAGTYTKLTFTIGVDSARNVAGAQTGALDPSHGMFWTWNTGYIFTKLEGRSAQASGNGGLTFHVGGFRAPNNTIRTVSPALPNGTPLYIRADHAPEVHLKVNVLGMFNGPTAASNIDFRTLSNTMGGAQSVKVANNYAAGMFRIDHVHTN
ncbi:MbnP family protein [Hymenobacter glacieicola]|uniref:Copper-binding protein MbnP-like domain-containing protein n=1 Tax=Hymenobacter glacieicola TaxID=1562124 RepID=A0ABQ1WTD5_9BACT|nr:MbnP family protein [Hymenobacter glacieicola]GGG40807.1 hypothetical protein GCM10011378_16350 [Hymenobacter glacieicola]